jgi:hypothetical protein
MCSCNNAVLPCCRYTTGQAGGKAKATVAGGVQPDSSAAALSAGQFKATGGGTAPIG